MNMQVLQASLLKLGVANRVAVLYVNAAGSPHMGEINK